MSESETADEEFAYTTRIEDGNTVIDVTGKHEVAFVIQSASGERIYFPPEDMEMHVDQDSPYQSQDSPYQSQDSPYQSQDSPYQADSPYQSADSPYQPSDDPEVSTRGVTETRTGFQIVHPEPASEITLFRGSVAV